MSALEWVRIEVGSSIEFPVWGAKEGDVSYIITLEDNEVRASFKRASDKAATYFNGCEPLPSLDLAMALCEVHRRSPH